MHGIVNVVDLVEAFASIVFEQLAGAQLHLLLGCGVSSRIYGHHGPAQHDLVVWILWILVKHELHGVHVGVVGRLVLVGECH